MFKKLAQIFLCIGIVIGSLYGGYNMEAKSDRTPLIILFGAPGSGKGTQAANLVNEFGFTHISTGDMFREHIRNQTQVGKRAKAYIDAGNLVPDEVVIEMLEQRLQMEDCKHGVLLDGYPRTIAQAQALNRLIDDKYDLVVLSLEVSDQTVLERLTGRRYCPNCNTIYHVQFTPPKKEGVCNKCGHNLATRDDDTEKTVRDRLTVFHSQSGPVKEFYRNKGVLYEIDGQAQPAQIRDACVQAVQQGLSA